MVSVCRHSFDVTPLPISPLHATGGFARLWCIASLAPGMSGHRVFVLAMVAYAAGFTEGSPMHHEAVLGRSSIVPRVNYVRKRRNMK